jgi:hypothetical protein
MEVKALADALAVIQEEEKKKKSEKEKETEDQMAGFTFVAQPLPVSSVATTSVPVSSVATTSVPVFSVATTLGPVVSVAKPSVTMTATTSTASASLGATTKQKTTITTVEPLTSTVSSVATTYATLGFTTIPSAPPVLPFRSITMTAATTVTSSTMTRPITSFPFDLTKQTLPDWLSKPLPPAKPMTGPTFVKDLTSAKISDIGSDRQADKFPEKHPPDFPPKRFNGRNKRKGQSPPISRKEFVPNFERPNTRSQAHQSTNFIPMEPTQAEKDFSNKRAELQEKEKEFQRKQAELRRQDSDLQRQKEELENQRK